jgi:hypothetical protein
METSGEKKPGFIKRHKKATFFAVLVFLLAVGGNYYVKQSTKKDPVNSASLYDTLYTDEEGSDNTTGPVAKVNGVEISRNAYQNMLKDLTMATMRDGYNTTDTSVSSRLRQQAVAILVNTELLYQDAIKDGVNVTEGEVEDQYEMVLKDMGSQEVLALTLKDMNITDDDLRTDIKKQLAVERHVKAKTNYTSISVTNEEVENYYKSVSANNPDLPSLNSVQVELKAELLAGKQQQAVSDFIQSLRAEAEIEILI